MEKAIKQRLLGGLVLVAGAVLFLPVLLDGSGASLTIPPMPAAPQAAGVDAIAPPLEEKVQAADQAVEEMHAGRDVDAPAGAGEEAAVTPDAAAVSAADGAAETAAPAQAPVAAAVPAPKPAPQSAPLPAPRPETRAAAPAAKPATLPEAWIVQVASFSSRDKAEALLKKLRAKKYAAVLRPQGNLWKVTVGPELSRSAADSVQARIEHDPEIGLKGIVQSYKP
jgi:DedD protein